MLGYLDPVSLAGGTVPLDAAAARAAFEEQVAGPLGRPLLDAAHGVFTLAVATMTRAVKAVTTYRGRDPRDFVLCCFGGNGPVAAAEIARALRIPHVIVPPAPGVFSAAGLLFSDVEHEAARTTFLRGEALSPAVLERDFHGLEAEARASLAHDGHAATSCCRAWPRCATPARPTSCPCRCRRGPSTSRGSSRASTPSTSAPTATSPRPTRSTS